MEISLMVSQLKSEEEEISKTLSDKTHAANSLRLQLGAIEMEIKKLKDRYDAIHMAVDSLELVNDDVPVKKEMKIAEQTKVFTPTKVSVNAHSRKAKRIGKFTPNGTQIGEYASINKAAKAFGWNNASMSKYIENTSKEKQIRIRGFYLKFLAA